jgi:hypothetical protein
VSVEETASVNTLDLAQTLTGPTALAGQIKGPNNGWLFSLFFNQNTKNLEIFFLLI